MEWLPVALGAMVFLACPLMMIVCVIGMRRMRNDAAPSAEIAAPATPEQTIADLERQLRAIEIELASLRTQPEKVAANAHSGALTATGAGHGARKPA